MTGKREIKIVELGFRLGRDGNGEAQIVSITTGAHFHFSRIKIGRVGFHHFTDCICKSIGTFAHDLDGKAARKLEKGLIAGVHDSGVLSGINGPIVGFTDFFIKRARATGMRWMTHGSIVHAYDRQYFFGG